MTKTQNLFFSCVDSRIQDKGSMYARFHLGTFFRGQGLTFANALRRTLLSEIPGLVLTDVRIQGANHEFAVLPGVEETVFDILLNLKQLVFIPSTSKNLQTFQATGLLKYQGPGKVTAADIKLPPTVKCVNPNAHVATLTSGALFSLRFTLQMSHPDQLGNLETLSSSENSVPKLPVPMVPTPIQKVNYVIKSLNAKQGSEYIILEVWTDGSVLPHEAAQFALRKLTQFFSQFATLGLSLPS